MLEKTTFKAQVALCAMAGAVLALGAGVAQAQTAADAGYAVALAADKRDADWGAYSTVGVMSLTDANGQSSQRQFEARVLEGAGNVGEKSVFRFSSPANIAGVTLLSHANNDRSDDQWLYLPSDRRTTQISSDDQTGSFVGSEFSYEDMTSVEVEKFTYEYLAEEACPGSGGALMCHKVKRVPTDPKSGYSLEVFWTDFDEYRTFRVDFYDRQGQPLKVLQAAQFKLYDNKYWRPSAMRMTNLQNNRSTTLQYSGYDFAAPADPNLYTVATVEAGL